MPSGVVGFSKPIDLWEGEVHLTQLDPLQSHGKCAPYHQLRGEGAAEAHSTTASRQARLLMTWQVAAKREKLG